MKRQLLLALIFISFTNLYSQTVTWVKQGADIGNGVGYGNGSDMNGNSYVAGYITPTTDFDGTTANGFGGQDGFLAKYSRTGIVQWVITFGGPGMDWATDVSTDSQGNSYVTGLVGSSATIGTFTYQSPTTLNFFVFKADASGNVIWAKFFNNVNDFSEGKSIAVDRTGQYLAVTGLFRNYADFDTIHITGNYEDVFTARLDVQTGTPYWVRTGGGTSDDEGQGITIDNNHNIIVSGYYKVNATFGSLTFPGSGDHDIFMIKYDVSGNILWGKYAAGPGHDDGFRVVADNNNNLFLEGIYASGVNFHGNVLTSAGGFDAYLNKYDSNGNLQWIINGGGAGDDVFSGFAFDYAGFLYVSGYITGNVNFGNLSATAQGTDLVLIKLDTSGTMLSINNYGGASDDMGFDLVYVPECYISIAGDFSSTATFDSFTLSAQGTDACLVMINATCATSIEEEGENFFSVSPIPASEKIRIKLKDGMKTSDCKFEIYNDKGVLLTKHSFDNISDDIDISGLSKGFYFIRVTNSVGSFTRKVIKI